jgi:hypothetical protein
MALPRASVPDEERHVSPRRIRPHKNDKRYIRRDKDGQFTERVNVGKSLSSDRRSNSKTVAPKDQGDQGDKKMSS